MQHVCRCKSSALSVVCSYPLWFSLLRYFALPSLFYGIFVFFVLFGDGEMGENLSFLVWSVLVIQFPWAALVTIDDLRNPRAVSVKDGQFSAKWLLGKPLSVKAADVYIDRSSFSHRPTFSIGSRRFVVDESLSDFWSLVDTIQQCGGRVELE